MPKLRYSLAILTTSSLCIAGCTHAGEPADTPAPPAAAESASRPSEARSAPGPSAEDPTGLWLGRGVMFTPGGELASEYEVRMTRDREGERETQHIEVLLPDGDSLQIEQTLAMEGDRFLVEGSSGEGGGYNLGDGMVLAHSRLADGKEQVQVIAMDGDEEMRIVRIELQGGEATRFFRESYRRPSR